MSSISMRIAVPLMPEVLSVRRVRPEVPELLDALEAARAHLLEVAVRTLPAARPGAVRAWLAVGGAAITSASALRGLRRVLEEPGAACRYLLRGWMARLEEAVATIGGALPSLAASDAEPSADLRARVSELEAAWRTLRDVATHLGRSLPPGAL